MKNKNLILLIIIAMMLLVACDDEKQPVNGNELIITNSGDVIEFIESGETINSGEKINDEYYEISLSKIESYELAELDNISIHKYELSGMKNLKSQKIINDKLNSLYNDVVNECERLKGNENFPELDCVVTMDNKDLFSFCISKKLATNNDTYVKVFYTVNKHTGELLELSDFYESSTYLSEVAKKIYNEFENRKNISGDNGYFFNLREKDFYEKIKINSQSFYISENNELIYYFQKYEIGSGALGEQEFILIENIEL